MGPLFWRRAYIRKKALSNDEDFQRILIFKLFITHAHNYITNKKRTKSFRIMFSLNGSKWISKPAQSFVVDLRGAFIFCWNLWLWFREACLITSAPLFQEFSFLWGKYCIRIRASFFIRLHYITEVDHLISRVLTHCSDKSSTSNMKIDTLSFLGCILAQHPPKVFHPHIHVLFPVSGNLRPRNCFFFL